MMLKLLVISSFLMVVISLHCVNAQEVNIEYTYKHYTIYDGLAQMQVMSLYQDRNGYLWCSTKAGLSRFDGQKFSNLNSGVLNLGGSDIYKFGENSNGDLMLFSPLNISKIEGDSIFHLPYPKNSYGSSSFARSRITGLQEVHVSANGEYSVEILNYQNPDSLFTIAINYKSGKIIHFDETDSKKIWQTDFENIFVSDLEENQIVETYPNPHKINSIFRNKECLYATNEKSEIYKFDGSEFKLVVDTKLDNQYFKAIPTPNNDGFIIKTNKDLFLYKTEMIPIKRNLTFIRDILFDNEENLWVATEEGLYNFFQLNFVNYTFGMGNKDWVWSVIEDNEKNFWFASYQNGLWKWDGKTITDYTETLNTKIESHLKRRPAPKQYRYYMGASKLGSTLYFPTECNVLKYENKEFSVVDNLVELPFQYTKALANGTLFFAGYPGLFQVNPNEEVKFWHRDSLKVSSVLNVEIDKNKQILAVGKKGIVVINDTSQTNYSLPPFLNSYCTAKDHKNNIWIGGLENINLYNGHAMKHVMKKRGEAFYSFLFIKPHYLLLGGLRGLYVANLHEFYKTGKLEMALFNQSSGFTGIECGQNGFLCDSEGMVWIPTSDLVSRFDPQKLIEKEIKPPKVFLKTEISNDNINWKTLKENVSEILKFKTNNLKFTIDIVSFANAGNVRYYFLLEGLQNRWSDATEVNEITFYNLKPGKYTFKAKADAGVSKATSETLSFEFEITKPWWQKWWFFVLLVVALLFVVATIVQLFRKREQNRAITKQRLLQLRSEALASQLDPHFVMNCLNNISGLVNAGYKEQANSYIVKFSKLLRVILQSIKKDAISLNDEIEMVRKYMELEQFRCNDCFSYKIYQPKNHSSENILVPPMMLQPLVENAVKHGFGNSSIKNAKIEIRIESNNQYLSISIADNGKGLQGTSSLPGTGLGTKITRERIELLQKKTNTKFKIKDRNPGVEVYFEIPLILKT